LDNGVVVLVYERFASPSVVVEGVVRVGALLEEVEHSGLANMTAAGLLRGTAVHDFDAIYESLEGVGASLSFSSGYHTTGFSGHCLREDLDLLLDIAAGALREPTFPEKEMELVRGEILTGLHMRADDTQQMANLTFNELIYSGHPYGRSSNGTISTVQALNAESCRQFHRHYYGPQEMIITIVGAIKAPEALAKVTAVLGDWQNLQKPPLPLVPDMPRPREMMRALVPMPDKQQADLRLGLPGPYRAAPDYLDVSLMNTILGVFGMMGRIGRKVRGEQGLAYYAYSQLQGGLGPAPWCAVAGVAPESIEAATQSILDEIARIQQELVPAEEVADSIAYRTGSLPVGLETNSGLAGVIEDLELYQLGLDYLETFTPTMHAITPERIQAAAQKYLSTTEIGIAVAGPVG
jgi:zinc protease